MKKLTALLILTVMLISCFGINVSAYDKEIQKSITANYDAALDLAGRRSFRDKCNLATAYQLTAAEYESGYKDRETIFAGAPVGTDWLK